jgi:hypothetical protein
MTDGVLLMGSGYVIAGYGLIWISLIGYAWRIRRRLVVAERDLAATAKSKNARETTRGNR